eukprot:12923251-Alexandrium_andersonii.AAC.1
MPWAALGRRIPAGGSGADPLAEVRIGIAGPLGEGVEELAVLAGSSPWGATPKAGQGLHSEPDE